MPSPVRHSNLHRISPVFIASLLVALTACEQKKAEAPENTSAQRNGSTSDLVHSRAVEAAIWGMPAVNYDLMLQEMLTKTQAKVGQVIYWGRPLDWHNQTLTPNPDALYFITFVNTKEGPVVLDLPPGDDNGSFNGNIVTLWQMPLADAGLLGTDKGKGGKYLILPPGYKEKIPAGYIPLQSDTLGNYMLFRANFKSHSDADVQSAVNYGKRIKVYPLAAAAHPPETVFTDVKDINFDSTIKYDASFFDHLNNVIQSEPWIDRDRAMIDALKSIGIEKGKPYQPSDQLKSTLNSAAQDARTFLYAKYDAGFPSFFPSNSHWMFPSYPDLVKAASSSYADLNAYPTDERAVVYSVAFIGIKNLGGGQMYLFSIKDKDGNDFDGAKTYKQTVPPNAPVKQYWSLTAYDRELHTLIKGVNRASRSSQIPELQKNPDGSIDLYIGPKAPDGKESNWIPTDPNRKFEFIFRAYAPTQALFDKTWVLPDVEME
ncbi:DUF1254 domain-containing protein [Tunturiibacter gelidoferens]|uniref:DUF1254 domain-containing protein n=1 Tax=Tunturiibacter gelidiferens TaxID=3069689 RepID=A0A9X0U590_9BACT|nr:DUF1254 domain-containing protein [Edaphobacter lichenicola]MBB5329785.1 hypothetical protein [Edaphobacter lichenicola]